MKISKLDWAKLWIFIASLMLIFGAGNYLASVMLVGDPSIDPKAVVGWDWIWILVALAGAVLMILAVVQRVKAKRASSK